MFEHTYRSYRRSPHRRSGYGVYHGLPLKEQKTIIPFRVVEPKLLWLTASYGDATAKFILLGIHSACPQFFHPLSGAKGYPAVYLVPLDRVQNHAS